MISLTEHVAQFVAGTRVEAIPDDVIELGKKSILDGLAVALSGSISTPARIVRDYVSEMSAGTCTAIGHATKLPPRFAALVNGTAMHADDYDDTLQAETGRYQGVHVTAAVLPAVLAMAEHREAVGRDLLTAYHVGIEVAARVFDATDVNHSLRGFHATATCGMLGAAAGVSNLLGFDVERAQMVLGLAASQAGGLLENIGSMTKPFHAGRSAECGVVANELVSRGFTASRTILEAPFGFYMAQGGGHIDSRLRGKLGNPWSFAERGVALKPFPSCALMHAALTYVSRLLDGKELDPAQIAGISVRTSRNVYDTLRNHAPTDALSGKFSMEFGIAALLATGRCGLAEFNDELVRSRDIRRYTSLITYQPYEDKESSANSYTLNTTLIEIMLKGGRSMVARVDNGKGTKAQPMTMDEVGDKFRECAERASWDKTQTETVIDLVQGLEKLPTITGLVGALVRRSA